MWGETKNHPDYAPETTIPSLFFDSNRPVADITVRFPGAAGRTGGRVADPSKRYGRGGDRRAGRADGRGAASVRRARPEPAARDRGRATTVRGESRGAVQTDRGRRAVRRIAAQERGRQDPAARTQGRAQGRARRRTAADRRLTGHHNLIPSPQGEFSSAADPPGPLLYIARADTPGLRGSSPPLPRLG